MNRQLFFKNQSSLLWQGALLIAAITLMSACFPKPTRQPVVQQNSYIKIKPEKQDPFTTPSLQRFVQDNKGASVVVRDSKAAAGVGVSGNSHSSKICSLIESALLKADFNVRDRQIFENVVNKMGDNIDYADLQKKTGTDLIFEVIDWGKDTYLVNHSYNSDGVEKQLYARKITGYDKKNKPIYGNVPTSYEFEGYHIEIKVIMLRENKVGGTYKYYYTPCSADNGGCKITSTGYIDNNDNKVYEKSEDRVADNDEKWHEELSNFLSKTVMPAIIKDMEVGNQ